MAPSDLRRSGGSRSRELPMPRRWSPRPAGTRSPRTGACFSSSAPSMRCATAGRVIATAATLALRRAAPGSAWCWSTAAHRRRGLATRLLHRCIADVTARGPRAGARRDPGRARGLSRRSDFEEAWGFSAPCAAQTAHAMPAAEASSRSSRSPMRVWPALCAYDAAVFGSGPQRRSSPACAAACRRPNLFARARRAHRRTAARARRPHRRRISGR